MSEHDDLVSLCESPEVLLLGDIAEEQEAYQRLAREYRPEDGAGQRLSGAAHCGRLWRELSLRTIAALTEVLSNALAVALAVSISPEIRSAFVQHPFWGGRHPTMKKPLLRVLQLLLQPDSPNEKKLLSRYAAAITWLVLQGYTPDTLAAGLAQEGGIAACAMEHAKWRRAHRPKKDNGTTGSVEQPDTPDARAAEPTESDSETAATAEGRPAESAAAQAPLTSEQPESRPARPTIPLPFGLKLEVGDKAVRQVDRYLVQIMRSKSFLGRLECADGVITLAEIELLPKPGKSGR